MLCLYNVKTVCRPSLTTCTNVHIAPQTHAHTCNVHTNTHTAGMQTQRRRADELEPSRHFTRRPHIGKSASNVDRFMGNSETAKKKTVCFCFLFISIFLYLFLSLLLPLAHSIHRCSSSASTFSELFPNRKKNVYSQFIMIWLIRFCPIAPLIFVLHHIKHTSNNEIRTPYIYLFDMFKKC